MLASQPDNSNNSVSAEQIAFLFQKLGTKELDIESIGIAFLLIEEDSGQLPGSLRDDKGNNLLHAAFLNEKPSRSTVWYLINETNIDVNGLNNAGQTPLDIVSKNNARRNHRALFKRFKEAGLKTAAELQAEQVRDDEDELVDRDEHKKHSYFNLRNGIIVTFLAVGGAALYKYLTNNKEKANA